MVLRDTRLDGLSFDSDRQAIGCLSNVLANAKHSSVCERELNSFQRLLATTSLTSDEMTLVRSQLERAKRCFEHNEIGVACYEVTSIVRVLASKRRFAQK